MSLDVLVDLSPLDTPSRYSGTGRYVHELGLALDRLSGQEKQGLRIAGLKALQGEVAIGSLSWPGSESDVSFESFDEVKWLNARRLRLPRTLRSIRPRLFHATYSLGTPRGSFVPRVVSCLDLIPLVMRDEYFPGRRGYAALMKAVTALRFHSARRVQAISRQTADDLMRLLHVPAKKIDVVYLGVDLERYHPLEGDEAAEASATRSRYDLSDRGYVFYIGAADPRKNVDVLVAAFAKARVSGLELVLIGKQRASDREAYRQAMAAAGNPAGVRFLGMVPEQDLPAIIAGALGLVFCSTYEGFGNVPVEAMACGCPVIHTGKTSIRETMADAGLRVPPRDIEQTAHAIRRLAKEPALAAQLRRQGIVRAQAFSWRNTALASVESYARALRP